MHTCRREASGPCWCEILVLTHGKGRTDVSSVSERGFANCVMGYVIWLRPSDGLGLLISDDGQEYRFRALADSARLSGGDMVSFRRLGGVAEPEATDVRLRARGLDVLGDQQRGLVRQFRETLRGRGGVNEQIGTGRGGVA